MAFTNGNAETGGAVQVEGIASFNQVAITDSNSTYGGGIAVTSGGVVDVYDSSVTGNTSEYGGAFYVEGELSIDAGATTTVSGNSATYGSAAYIEDGRFSQPKSGNGTINFTDNTSSTALFYLANNSYLSMITGSIYDNSSLYAIQLAGDNSEAVIDEHASLDGTDHIKIDSSGNTYTHTNGTKSNCDSESGTCG